MTIWFSIQYRVHKRRNLNVKGHEGILNRPCACKASIQVEELYDSWQQQWGIRVRLNWRSIDTALSSPSWQKTQESTCLLRPMPIVSNSMILLLVPASVGRLLGTWTWTIMQWYSIYTYTSRHQHTALYTCCISDFFHSKTSPTGPTEQTPKKTWVSNNSSNFGVRQDSVPFNFWWSHTYRASQVSGNPAPASPRATSGSQVHFLMLIHHWFVVDIVDGSEIRRSLVDMVNVALYMWVLYISEVVQDFFHQQYVSDLLNWPGITRRRGVAFIFFTMLMAKMTETTRYRWIDFTPGKN